jgi:hypothetical protein
MPTRVVPAAVRSQLGADASEELVEMFTAYHELAGMRADLIKWSLLFWLGQCTAVLAALSFMLDGR